MIHALREKYNLTLNEYGILDSIYQLQIKQEYCTASKEYLGRFIGISRQSVNAIINKLIRLKLIVKTGRYLKTTEEWDRYFIINKECKDSLQSEKQKEKKSKDSLQKSKDSLHNNNNIDKDIYINIENHYFALFKKELGVEPAYEYGRDRKILGKYIKKYGQDKVKEILTCYIKNKIGSWCGYTITGLQRNLNKILIIINKEAKDGDISFGKIKM